jgi:hypothetical protein
MLVAFKISVLWLLARARDPICSFLPVGNTGAMPSLLLVTTKYGLRLHVSHDAIIKISYIQHPKLRKKFSQLRKRSVHDHIDS